MSESEFRLRYHVSVLALRHRGERLTTNLAQHRLDFGDMLLVSGGWDDISRMGNKRDDFVVLTLSKEHQERLPARRRAPVAVAILAMMVAAMASGLIHITAAALLAALAMLATRCVPSELTIRKEELITMNRLSLFRKGETAALQGDIKSLRSEPTPAKG